MFEDIRDLNKAIKQKRERIEELRWQLVSTNLPVNADRVQSSGSKDRLGDLMCKIIILETELESMETEYGEMTGEAIRRIYSLGNDEWSDILYTHYIEFKPLQEIANIKGVSLNAIRSRNNRAIKKYKRIIDETK